MLLSSGIRVPSTSWRADRLLAWQNCTMQEDEKRRNSGRPSKSARKREAAAAQDLGTRLIALKESDCARSNLPRETARRHPAREAHHQPRRPRAPAAVHRQAHARHRPRADRSGARVRSRAPRPSTRKSTSASKPGARACSPKGRRRSMSSSKWCPDADRKSLQALISKATERAGRSRQPRSAHRASCSDAAQLV